jgi:hypothetical protein
MHSAVEHGLLREVWLKTMGQNIDWRIVGAAEAVMDGLKIEYGWMVRTGEGAVRRIRNQN